MKRILVTGATGFIGRHSLAPLVDREYEVHAVSSRTANRVSAGVEWHTADLLDPAAIRELMLRVRPTHLLHFAWHVVPGKWTVADPETNLRWVQASLELLQRFRKVGGTRAVMVGSGTEYDWRYGFCAEGVTPTNPATFYGACKHALQNLVWRFCAEVDLSHAWGRIFFVYGPHEAPTRLAPSVILSLLRGEPARCTHGNQIRDYLHVQDVADAFVLLLESDVEGPVNIASGVPVALKEIVHAIACKLGGTELVRLGAIPARPSDAPLVVADVTRLTSEVGWRPAYDLQSGLDHTISWWKDHITQEHPELQQSEL